MAIRGKKKEDLTYDTLIDKITEYNVYKLYLGRDFEIGTAIHSPFRDDNNPSFSIGNRGGFLHHKDYADTRYSGNCVQFVMQMFNLTYNEALLRIDEDFSTGLGATQNRIITPKTVVEKPKETLIQAITRKMDTADLTYWRKFHLEASDLKEENVYALKKLWMNKTPFPIKNTELVFGYLYEDKWKIYFPEATDKRRKWFSNVPITYMDGLENIQGCGTSLIVKSKKEKMVAKKFLTGCVAAVQNESIGSISEENINYLQKNSKDTYLIFDNDKVGVESCTYYNQFGFKYWNVPKEYIKEGIKDMAELVSIYGPERLKEEINKKIKL